MVNFLSHSGVAGIGLLQLYLVVVVGGGGTKLIMKFLVFYMTKLVLQLEVRCSIWDFPALTQRGRFGATSLHCSWNET